jgi:hypothetical protein
MVWALELQDARLTPAAKFVLVAICDAAHEDKKFDCNVKHETISSKVNMSVDTVQRRVSELASLGYLHVLRRRGADGRQIANRYIVLVDEDAKTHALAHGWAIRAAGREFERDACDLDRSIDRTDGDADAAEPQIAARSEPQIAARSEPQIERSRAANETEPSRTVAAQEQTLTVLNKTPLSPPRGGEAASRDFRKSKALRESGDEASFDPEADHKRFARWNRFNAAWPWGTHELIEQARRAFLELSDDEQEAALKAIPKYLAYCNQSGRTPIYGKTWLYGKGWLAVLAQKSVEGDAKASYRERIEQMQREKEDRQRALYGGVFVKAHSPQADAWRAFETAEGGDWKVEYKTFGVLGTGFIRPSLWPPRAQKTG